MEPEFYGDLVYKLKKLIERNGFSHQFRKLVMFYKRIGYSLDVMRPSACLVFNPLMIVCYASIFNCTLHDYGVDLVGWDRSVLSVAWPTVVQLVFFFFNCSRFLVAFQGSPTGEKQTVSLSLRF